MNDLLRGDPDFPRAEREPDWQSIEDRLERIAGSLEHLVDAASGAEQQRNELRQDLAIGVSNAAAPSREMARLLRSVRFLIAVACVLLFCQLIFR